MSPELVQIHMSLYRDTALVRSSDGVLFARDWAAMQADAGNALTRGKDGKPIVTQTDVSPEGAVTIVIYQES